MCKRGNPIRSNKFNHMMKMLVYTVASLMQMNSFLFHNYWLLLGKKKIAKYSVFLVPIFSYRIGLRQSGIVYLGPKSILKQPLPHLGMSRLCSATFEQFLAFGATFRSSSNLEQLLRHFLSNVLPNYRFTA